ncbi:MAG: hypothetical protein SFV15_19565 [Polyangiaceae bacterium]|nr:hypothetical protein [Polyangiaceae bacterium]
MPNAAPKCTPATNDIDIKQVVDAVQDLGLVAQGVGLSLVDAIRDAGAKLGSSIDATGSALVAALTRAPEATKDPASAAANAIDTVVRYSTQLRPLSEKTASERAALEKMRTRTNSGAKQ